jgi:hypothetical protein
MTGRPRTSRQCTPLVGAALAELLDKIAWMVGIDPDLMGRVGCEEVLKIARAYLGEVSR